MIVQAFTKECRDNAIRLLYMIPNGIQTKSMDIEGLVQSSSNLGIVHTGQSKITYSSVGSVRSLRGHSDSNSYFSRGFEQKLLFILNIRMAV